MINNTGALQEKGHRGYLRLIYINKPNLMSFKTNSNQSLHKNKGEVSLEAFLADRQYEL